MCENECAICALAGGCLTAMYEDNYCPASRKQVEKRLENGEFLAYTALMKKYISNMPIEKPIQEGQGCCEDIREIRKRKENDMPTKDMLEDRTVNIMMIAKRIPLSNMKQSIAKYMSDECSCPISVYTDDVIYSIVKNAFFDFLFHANKASTMALVRRLFETVEPGEDDCIKMLIALSLTQVAERDENGNYHYINGFHDTEFSKTALDFLWVKGKHQATDEDLQRR